MGEREHRRAAPTSTPRRACSTRCWRASRRSRAHRQAILARHSMEAVPSLQVVRNSVPDEVEDAVMQALEKTPADRLPPCGISPMRSPRWISGAPRGERPPARCGSAQCSARRPAHHRQRTRGAARASSQGQGVCPVSRQGVLVSGDRRDSGCPGPLGMAAGCDPARPRARLPVSVPIGSPCCTSAVEARQTLWAMWRTG